MTAIDQKNYATAFHLADEYLS